jgi:glycosyltransferase involved in cell wall biosynthesis
MDKILLSAFACDPSKGSEPGNGWNWATGLSDYPFEVHCLTRIAGKQSIEVRDKSSNLHFHFIVLPFGLEGLYKKGNVGMYTYYMIWQWYAYLYAKKLIITHSFKLVHHVTWGSIQMGSHLYRLNLPFIFGPSGGGQKAPVAFRQYFLNHWASEEKREKFSDLMKKHNPAFKTMLRRAKSILVSNEETQLLAQEYGAKNVTLTLDAALSESFYPKNFIVKSPEKDSLKLLWVGRFMPRKGLLLVLEVMKELQSYPGITLTVVGDGELKDSFLKKRSEYGLEEKVDWKGTVPFNEVKNYYVSHDVFFFTSLRDSCPAQLIEAMAFGLPVVTLNLHGQALIVNDEIGIRCPCSSPDMAISSLKQAVLKLYCNPDMVSSMSEMAHEFAIQQNWDNKIKNIVTQHYPE